MRSISCISLMARIFSGVDPQPCANMVASSSSEIIERRHGRSGGVAFPMRCDSRRQILSAKVSMLFPLLAPNNDFVPKIHKETEDSVN